VSKLRFAVIGGGHLGRIHAKLLAARNDAELVVVVDPSPASRDMIQQMGLPVCEDFKTLSGRIDAAIIATPTTYHFDIATWCLKNRIHSFVEKPMVLQADQAHRLCELASANHCTLQVGHVERFNPAWTATANQLQEPVYIEANRIGTYSGRSTDIGIVFDLMVHDLDLILQIVDSPLARVAATGISLLGKHEDFAEARLEFENGCVANLTSSRLHRQPIRKMSVYCKKVFAELDFASATAELMRPSDEVLSRDWQADALPESQRLRVKDELYERWFNVESVQTTSVNAILEEHNDFLNSITQGVLPQVTGDHGRQTIEIAAEIVSQIQQAKSTTVPSLSVFAPSRKAG
jgi:predicted dehydrogenase